jgi:hypothetical protein
MNIPIIIIYYYYCYHLKEPSAYQNIKKIEICIFVQCKFGTFLISTLQHFFFLKKKKKKGAYL